LNSSICSGVGWPGAPAVGGASFGAGMEGVADEGVGTGAGASSAAVAGGAVYSAIAGAPSARSAIMDAEASLRFMNSPSGFALS
jgi:hypothetical protein